jgi:hypothetical protein
LEVAYPTAHQIQYVAVGGQILAKKLGCGADGLVVDMVNQARLYVEVSIVVFVVTLKGVISSHWATGLLMGCQRYVWDEGFANRRTDEPPPGGTFVRYALFY